MSTAEFKEQNTATTTAAHVGTAVPAHVVNTYSPAYTLLRMLTWAHTDSSFPEVL
jgi:hypothetical protein